jgi:hypothetical protein
MKLPIKILLILSWLLTITIALSSQNLKWYKVTGNDIGLMVSAGCFGGFYGWNQAIDHHHWGRGSYFWDGNESWKNKYKDYDNGDKRAKFFLSKSILVPVTDGFHLTQFLYRSSGLVTIGIALNADLKAYKKSDRWKVIMKKLLLTTLSERLMFNVVFHSLGSE